MTEAEIREEVVAAVRECREHSGRASGVTLDGANLIASDPVGAPYFAAWTIPHGRRRNGCPGWTVPASAGLVAHMDAHPWGYRQVCRILAEVQAA